MLARTVRRKHNRFVVLGARNNSTKKNIRCNIRYHITFTGATLGTRKHWLSPQVNNDNVGSTLRADLNAMTRVNFNQYTTSRHSVPITRYGRILSDQAYNNMVVGTRTYIRPVNKKSISTSGQRIRVLRSLRLDQFSIRKTSGRHVHVTPRKRVHGRIITLNNITRKMKRDIMTKKTRHQIGTNRSIQVRPTNSNLTNGRYSARQLTKFRNNNQTES